MITTRLENVKADTVFPVYNVILVLGKNLEYAYNEACKKKFSRSTDVTFSWEKDSGNNTGYRYVDTGFNLNSMKYSEFNEIREKNGQKGYATEVIFRPINNINETREASEILLNFYDMGAILYMVSDFTDAFARNLTVNISETAIERNIPAISFILLPPRSEMNITASSMAAQVQVKKEIFRAPGNFRSEEEKSTLLNVLDKIMNKIEEYSLN
ncbi:hypothetical protein [Caldiplasma sukawensis]